MNKLNWIAAQQEQHIIAERCDDRLRHNDLTAVRGAFDACRSIHHRTKVIHARRDRIALGTWLAIVHAHTHAQAAIQHLTFERRMRLDGGVGMLAQFDWPIFVELHIINIYIFFECNNNKKRLYTYTHKNKSTTRPVCIARRDTSAQHRDNFQTQS